MVDYLNELRETCLDAYSGIIQGLKGDGQQASPDVLLLQPHVAYIIQFICVVAGDQERSDSSLGAAAGLLGLVRTEGGTGGPGGGGIRERREGRDAFMDV